MEGTADEYLLYPEDHDFDWMFGTMRRRKDLYTEDLRRFLLALRPDVVHFQHTLFIGYDAIREIRRTLPDMPIVYTLHEFLPICHNKGQMVRTMDRSLCGEATAAPLRGMLSRHRPRRVLPAPALHPRSARSRRPLHRPQRDPARAFRRVGHPARAHPAGGLRPGRGDARWDADFRPAPHDTFGIFGQVNPYKGIDVLLRAMQALGDEAPQLRVHGANLDLQEHSFRDEISDLLAATAGGRPASGPTRPSGPGR